MYAGTSSSRTSTNLSRSCWNAPDGGIVVAGTRDSPEIVTLINLTVDFDSTAPENAAAELVNDSDCNGSCTDTPMSSADGPIPDVDIVLDYMVPMKMRFRSKPGLAPPDTIAKRPSPETTTAAMNPTQPQPLPYQAYKVCRSTSATDVVGLITNSRNDTLGICRLPLRQSSARHPARRASAVSVPMGTRSHRPPRPRRMRP